MLQHGEKLEGGERTTQKGKAGGWRFWIVRRNEGESVNMRIMRMQGSHEKENRGGTAKGARGNSLDSVEGARSAHQGCHERGGMFKAGGPDEEGALEGEE